ncbi:MAG: lantibiotic dehydratase [Chthoniobacterales bacterium]|nr:lantibiotic dehydratase [Chthoniobacterales bacterium]
MSSYRVAPIFLIRAAGVPFDHLERLAAPQTAALARELLVRRSELAAARGDAERILGTRESCLSAEVSRAGRAALRSGVAARNSGEPLPEEILRFVEIADVVAKQESQLQKTLEVELQNARASLYDSSRTVLPAYLVFGAGEFRDRLAELSGEHAGGNGHLPLRNSRTRERERHLLLYLQRVSAKNDTFSEFGPSAWGRIERQTSPLSLAPEGGIAERRSFLERWAAHTLAAALNQDAEARMEFAPRPNPNGRLTGDEFILLDSAATVPLAPEAVELVRRCDGKTPAHALDTSTELLEMLAASRVILWQAEVPALEPQAFDVVLSDVVKWRDSPVRARWLDRAGSLASLPSRFKETADLAQRSAAMKTAQRLLDDLGPKQAAQRSLYSAANPIAEECFRRSSFVVSETLTEELARDIEPWVNLWRDTYAFVASRVAEGLQGLFRTAPIHHGAVTLPAFLQHCATHKLSLTGHGIVAMAHMAFQEVKAAFRKSVSARSDAAEWEMSADDCAFVRKNFEYPKFDEYTYPSADLQISAESPEAVERGDYQWIVSELHPPVAMLHHALYWSCPDRVAMARELASTTFGRPAVHYGFFAADFTAHTVVRQMDVLPEQMTFVAPQRSNPRWRTVPPAEVEVYIEESTGDVCLRKRGSHEHLGSFARAWIIPLGFHPFFFGRAPHMPRLRCGKAIVQRRSWTVTLPELGGGNFTGISRALVLAVEQLRSARDLPRYVYIRPTEQALRRSGAEGRDKDTKPVFIDLESYLSLEIFHRWLSKAGEVEITEMLPDPDHLLWREADGRRTFELRTLIVPRS